MRLPWNDRSNRTVEPERLVRPARMTGATRIVRRLDIAHQGRGLSGRPEPKPNDPTG